MKKKFFNMIALLLFITGVQASCNKEDSPMTSPRQPEQTPAAAGTFARGADVSWVTQMESEGLTFADRNGVPTELMALLKMLSVSVYGSTRRQAGTTPTMCW